MPKISDNPFPDKSFSSERVTRDLDALRCDELARHADLGVNLWQSLQLAAERGDAPAARALCQQIQALTRAAFALVKELGRPETDNHG